MYIIDFYYTSPTHKKSRQLPKCLREIHNVQLGIPLPNIVKNLYKNFQKINEGHILILEYTEQHKSF